MQTQPLSTVKLCRYDFVRFTSKQSIGLCLGNCQVSIIIVNSRFSFLEIKNFFIRNLLLRHQQGITGRVIFNWPTFLTMQIKSCKQIWSLKQCHNIKFTILSVLLQIFKKLYKLKYIKYKKIVSILISFHTATVI